MQQIIERWNATIAEVFARVDATLTQASTRSQAVISQIGHDLTPLVQSWGPVEHQMHQCKDQVADAWDQTSDDLSDLDDLPDEVMVREGGKRDWALDEIDIRYARAYRLTMAAAADVMREHAQAADAQTLRCSRCGAMLDGVELSGLALNVECGGCGAVNTIEPGEARRAFAAVGAMALAERQALHQWEAMTRALTQINMYEEAKAVPLGLLQEYERAARGYWTERLTAEADLVPELRPFVAEKIESYLKAVHKTLREHWQWRQFVGG
jgi:phage FluMu protein Com